MESFKKTEIDNFSTGKTIKCYCNKCEKKINHTVIKSVKGIYKENSLDYGVDGSSDYQILKCNGCNDHSFRVDEYFSEYVDYDSDGSWEILYPLTTEFERKQLDFDDLPYNLDLIYKESIKSFNSKNYILCAVGIRAILEGICKDQKISNGTVEKTKSDGTQHQVKSNNLDGKINGLHQKGIITIKHSGALHELRFLGNNAIHELESPKKKDLITAFDIIEHILIDIYEIPNKANRLKERRKKN